MSISVNTSIPVIAAQGVAADIVLQPGSVINAQVLQVLSADLVRIAISNIPIDVLTEIPLAAGQNLQLAVSQTTDGGVRLAVVGQGSSAGTQGTAATAGASLNTPAVASGTVGEAAANPAPSGGPAANQLTAPEQVALTTAVANAATQQGSLSPLFANLSVVAASNNLPPALRQAISQVLAQQTNLDQNLTASDLKNAVQKSGIFLEASLASGPVLATAGIPDLKAALIVLRQALLSSLPTAPGSTPPAPAQQPLASQPSPPSPPPSQQPSPPTSSPQPASPQPSVSPETPSTADAASAPHAAVTLTAAPPLSPEIDVHEILLPQARLPVAEDTSGSNEIPRIVLPPTLLNPAPRATTVAAALNILQEVVQEFPRDVGKAPSPATPLQGARNDDVTVHTNTPPPPFRGALPSTQPVALPSIAPEAPLATSVRHLLDDTEAALARQTLLQAASLPDAGNPTRVRLDPATPRWNFEIPFVTPQGTAVTQFEISRDGGGNEAEATQRVWRARFSIDLEPAGPVHALVSLSGERTSVRMWAERPATVAQLRAGAAQLTQALSKAELVPGEIVIRDGAPPQSAPARAGHFLDRAL
jgi:hypothetical protein